MPRDFFNNTKNYETQHYFGKQSSMTTGEYRAHYAQFEKDHIVETNLVNASDIAARAMDSIHKQELQNASESERPLFQLNTNLKNHISIGKISIGIAPSLTQRKDCTTSSMITFHIRR